MAVIDSKGNGFSLFNGVKLPSSPEYDSVANPNAIIFTYGEKTYFSVCNSLYFSYDGSLYANIGSGVPTQRWVLDANSWTSSEAIENIGGEGTPYSSIIWANTDVADLTLGGQFSASDPISLDGMNVIEWDGDTTGLSTFPSGNAFFLVSSAANVDVSQNVTFVRQTKSALSVANAALGASDGYYTFATGRYVEKASEAYPDAGIYFLCSAITCLLFAYYPIAEPEQPEIDRGTRFLLYKIFSPDVFYAITGKKHWSE